MRWGSSVNDEDSAGIERASQREPTDEEEIISHTSQNKNEEATVLPGVAEATGC